MKRFLLGLIAAMVLSGGVMAQTVGSIPSPSAPGAVLPAPVSPGLPGLVNWGPQQANFIIRDIANVTTAGPKSAGRWPFELDSTGAGNCAIAGSPCTDSRALSYPVRLGVMMNAAGEPTDQDNWFGCNNETTIAACVAYDPRLAAGTGWAILAQYTAGGYALNFPANTTPTPLTFTPAGAFNQCDVYGINNTATASFVIDKSGSAPTSSSIVYTGGQPATISGGTVSTVTSGTGIFKATLTWSGAATTGALNINAVSSSTGKFYIAGEACRDTANPKIEIYNMAAGGSNSTNWAAGGNPTYGPLAFLGSQFINPTVTWNGQGINDWNTPATALSTYKSNITTLQTQANTTGGNVMIMGMQSNPASFASVATQNSYGAVMQSLSVAAKQPFINLQYRWTSWANGCALGFYGSNSSACDGRHGSATGYQDQANMIMGALRQLVGP